ncbi:MAG TPA: hypothetical protein VHL98_03290 [Microvirga sp.]|jgi:hypothetical protein|nr:hypothetical protein [Microvirga sp.]
MDEEVRHERADGRIEDRSEARTARLLVLAVVVALVWIVVAGLWSARFVGLI